MYNANQKQHQRKSSNFLENGQGVRNPQNNFGQGNLPPENLNNIRQILERRTSIIWLFIISVGIRPAQR